MPTLLTTDNAVCTDEPFWSPDEAQLAAAAFLARYNGRTLEAYRHDLRCYSHWASDRHLAVLGATRAHIEVPPIEYDGESQLIYLQLSESHTEVTARSSSLRKTQKWLPAGSASTIQPVPSHLRRSAIWVAPTATNRSISSSRRRSVGTRSRWMRPLLRKSSTSMNNNRWSLFGSTIMHSSSPGSLGSSGTSV